MTLAMGEHGLMQWYQRPSGSDWDPEIAVRSPAAERDGDRFVSLEALLARIGQGIAVSSAARGDVAVRLIGVSDMHPLLIGDGEVGYMDVSSIRRHLAIDGDVLISRVGRIGQVGCVTHATESLVPRAGLLVARPLRKRWGPAMAAALCTDHSRELLKGMMAGGRSASLTIEQLSAIPVPSPRHFDYHQVDELVDAAGELVRAGCEVLDRVRGEISMRLEGAPIELSKRAFTWVAEPAWLAGWGWSDVERYLLATRLRFQAGTLVQLGEMIDLGAHRASTVDAVGGARGLDSNEVRPDWYLALPTTKPANGGNEPSTRTTPMRHFEVDRECLLIPTVGDVTGAPVVIPEELAGSDRMPVAVPTYWLPLVKLAWPRALAAVLDHPFVRLQRQLAAAFSTVTHITREDIADLLIPVVSNDLWDRWETDLRQAHRNFIDADAKAKQAIAIAEGWYA
jgi:hypothetical protein